MVRKSRKLSNQALRHSGSLKSPPLFIELSASITGYYRTLRSVFFHQASATHYTLLCYPNTKFVCYLILSHLSTVNGNRCFHNIAPVASLLATSAYDKDAFCQRLQKGPPKWYVKKYN